MAVNFTPVQIPQVATPAVPATPGVRMPGNIAREDYLAQRLDPSSPTWVGLGARGAIRGETSTLQEQLKGYGNFTYGAEDAYGARSITQQGGNPGELYRRAWQDSQAQAAAAGMLGSSFADQAVGTAWNRISAERRALLNQYAQNVSTHLNNAASSASEVTNQLMDLYGADVQYALQNPAPVATPTVLGASPATPASAPAQAPSSAANSLIGKRLDAGVIRGVYAAPPNTDKVKARFGPTAVVKRAGTGQYLVLTKDG